MAVTLDAFLARSAATRPAHVAVLSDDAVLTYRELDERASFIAHELVAAGCERGAHIGIVLPPGAAFAEAFWGVLRAGAVAVPVDPRLGPDDRAARLTTCALAIDGAGHGVPGARLPQCSGAEPDDTAVVIHTSGTTAAPKPVELTHRNWWWSAAGSAVALGHDPEDRWLCALPVAHVGGLSILVRAAIGGTTAVLHERFDTARVANALSDANGPTLISVVPTMLARLIDAGLARPPALRAALVGGGPILPELLTRAGDAGMHCVTTYGLTEACSQVTTGGPPLFCTDVTIDDTGEIAVRGPTVAPAALDADGWLRTGDLGALDARGHLTVVGRASDTIVTGGENVAPAEVEAVLESHPGVREAGVSGRPDELWGEAVVATVVMRDGWDATEEELRTHVRGRIAGFKVPKAITFTDALPRTASGKLLRRDL